MAIPSTVKILVLCQNTIARCAKETSTQKAKIIRWQNSSCSLLVEDEAHYIYDRASHTFLQEIGFSFSLLASASANAVCGAEHESLYDKIEASKRKHPDGQHASSPHPNKKSRATPSRSPSPESSSAASNFG